MMRRHDTVKLTKDGLFGERYSKRIDDRIVEGIRATGKKEGEFFWLNINTPINVEGKVTLLDLIRALAKMNVEELHALSLISSAHIAPYLIDFATHPEPVPDADDHGKLEAIEVYKTIELDNHSSGNDLYDISVSTSAHGKGEIWNDCMKDVAAGKSKLEDVKECNSYAIEFTPWQKMLDLPIRIRENVYFTEMVWKECKPKKMEIGILGSKRKFSMGMRDRDLVERKGDRKVRGEMSLGEFFTGLFNELCFFGSPASRKVEDGVLRDRVKDVEKVLTKEKKKKKKK